MNQVFIVGNLGQDPELKSTKNGKAFCRISVATNDRGMNAEGEEYERTTWHSVHIFGKQAEWTCSRLHKGSFVFVEARIDKSTEELENGEKKTQIFFTARQIRSFSPEAHVTRDETMPLHQEMNHLVAPSA